MIDFVLKILKTLPQQLCLSLYSVFTAVRLEKLTSHRYVVENESNVKIALFVRMGNSSPVANQKLHISHLSCKFGHF